MPQQLATFCQQQRVQCPLPTRCHQHSSRQPILVRNYRRMAMRMKLSLSRLATDFSGNQRCHHQLLHEHNNRHNKTWQLSERVHELQPLTPRCDIGCHHSNGGASSFLGPRPPTAICETHRATKPQLPQLCPPRHLECPALSPARPSLECRGVGTSTRSQSVSDLDPACGPLG